MDQHIYFVQDKIIKRHIVIKSPFKENNRIGKILEGSIRHIYTNYDEVEIEYLDEEKYILSILTIYDLKEHLNNILGIDKRIFLFNPFIKLERINENTLSSDCDLNLIRENFLYTIGFLNSPFIFIDENFKDKFYKDRYDKDRLMLNEQIIKYIIFRGDNPVQIKEEKQNIIKSIVEINKKELLILVRKQEGFFMEYRDGFITILGKPNTENFNSINDLTSFTFASFNKDYIIKNKNKKYKYYRNSESESIISDDKIFNVEQLVSIKYQFENPINVKSKYYSLFLEKTNALNIFRDYKEGENIFLSKRQILINNKKSSNNHLNILRYLVHMIYYCSELSDKKINLVEKISGINYKKYCQNTIKEIKRPIDFKVTEETLKLNYSKEGDYLYISNKNNGDIWFNGESYYKCIDPNLPKLGFVSSLIPNKICIPCCYRNQKNIYDICKFKNNEQIEIDNKIQLVNFGRLLINNRMFSKLPPWLENYYNSSLSNLITEKTNKTTKIYIKECKDLYVIGYLADEDFNIKKDEELINYNIIFSLDNIYKNMNVSNINKDLINNIYIKVQFRLFRLYKISIKNYEIIKKELINYIPLKLKNIIEENYYKIILKDSQINLKEPLILKLNILENIKNIIYDNDSTKFLLVINDYLKKLN